MNLELGPLIVSITTISSFNAGNIGAYCRGVQRAEMIELWLEVEKKKKRQTTEGMPVQKWRRWDEVEGREWTSRVWMCK